MVIETLYALMKFELFILPAILGQGSFFNALQFHDTCVPAKATKAAPAVNA